MNNELEAKQLVFRYPPLEEGSTGNEVIILQEKLKLLGDYDASITGSFGPRTTESVKRFQQDQRLEPTGVVGKDTWEALFRLTNNMLPASKIQTKPTLRLGSSGPYVIELQRILTDLLYYKGPINGIFDSSVQTAVKSFQSINHLTADGIVGRDTWSALDTLYSPLAICEGETGEENTISYTVVAGDSLWSIAKKFGTTVDEIKRLNNLTNDTIFIGQVLKIPVKGESIPPQDISTYTVVAGDTLWSIAKRFSTTVDELKRLNQLTSDNLRIGQILKVPSIKTYTVVAGDTLWGIARRFATTVDEIKRLNQLTSDNLKIGQILRIP